MTSIHGWASGAIHYAIFAALTVIFAKIGIQDVDSNLAALISKSP